jgi:hypothetical protein
MRLVTHGGKCCGIKIIHSLLEYPTLRVDEVEDRDFPEGWSYAGGSGAWEYGHPGEDFFFEEAPKETYLERMERYIAYCKTHRPKGMIEVTTAGGQNEIWKGHLEGFGFKLVNEFKNSNSGNTVFVYHLVYS